MAKKKKKRIASRGSVNNIILKTLYNGDKYGYEIIKEVEEYSAGKILLKQPSLYSSLSRFEERGFVSSYWGDSDIGGRRHYYHLTDAGLQYYKHAILKEDVEEDNNEIETVVKVTEINENQIPATINFESKPDNSNNIIADHNFYKSTPIEKFDSIKKEIVSDINSKLDDKLIWKDLATRVKANNSSCANSANKRLHYNQPKKMQKVILDSDGIYKLRDVDYVPSNRKAHGSNIIDNVGHRIPNKEYDYNSSNPKPTNIPHVELTDEERRIRNENFLAKFNLISKSKMKEPKVKQKVEEQKPEKEINYRSKLDLIIDNSQREMESKNNMFNYVDEEQISYNDSTILSSSNNNYEDEDDKFIDFEPAEFSIKNDNNKYIEEISNSAPLAEDIRISKYESKSTAVLSDKTYILINRCKCAFGFVLLFLLMAELTISYFVFKNNNLIFDSDKKLFLIAYIGSAILSFGFMLPALINSQEHKINSFKVKYSLIFGILTFLISIILIYCINSLMGFDLDNFKYFAVKLILPAILSFNFVICPPLYALISKSKKFYD